MLKGMFSDLAQRVLTGNKIDQRYHLKRLVQNLMLPVQGRVLDFGCGTGLFAPVFRGLGLDYFGYDINMDSLAFARLLYRDCLFTSDKDALPSLGPFDLLLANCCFHHIPNDILLGILEQMASLLGPAGKFVFIDILRIPNDPSAFHRGFMKLEQGEYVRIEEEYIALLTKQFSIQKKLTFRSNMFSIPSSTFPFGNNLLVLVCSVIV
jgi:SAM-dependent methyltransferase